MTQTAEAPPVALLLEEIDTLCKQVAYYQEKHEQAELQCIYLRSKIEEIEQEIEETIAEKVAREYGQLTQECEFFRNKAKEVEAAHIWRKQLDGVSNKVMSPSQKDTTNRLLRYIEAHPERSNADGYIHLQTWELAPNGEQSQGTLYDNINYVSTVIENGKPDKAAIIPLFHKKIVHIPEPLPFKPYHYREETYIKALDLVSYPEAWKDNCTTFRQQGGAGRGQGRKKSCEKCGCDLREEDVVISRQLHTFCPRCKIEHVYPVRVVGSEQFPTDDSPPDDNGGITPKADNQVDFQLSADEEAEEATNQLDHVIPTIVRNQVDYQPSEGEDPITPPLALAIGEYPLNGFSLEAWLSNRRGHGPMIYSTGILDQSKKYLHKPATYNPDITAYLRGDLQHIYGSRPAFEDGTTSLFGGDCDTPELDTQHLEWMTQLAAAGIASIYWLRRTGRGHLEVYTDKAVDRKAFYAHLVSVCPGLAAIPECFPIGKDQNTSGDDRTDFPYSWPLYYRVSNQVIECAAEVMFAGDQVPMLSTGIQSDRNRLIWLISQAIMPEATIPALPPHEEVTQETSKGVVLLDIPRIDRTVGAFDDGLGKAVIAAFNEQPWEKIVDVENNRFHAIWRKEKTPSVVINADGTAHDYGQTKGYPSHFDKFEAYCLINGLNKSDEIKRRIADYRRMGEQIAS